MLKIGFPRTSEHLLAFHIVALERFHFIDLPKTVNFNSCVPVAGRNGHAFVEPQGFFTNHWARTSARIIKAPDTGGLTV